MRLIHQDWVCLVNEDELQAARRHASATAPHDPRIRAPLWRQVQLKGTVKALLLELTCVGESPDEPAPAAVAPLQTPLRCGFSWEDLDDAPFLFKMLAREQFEVSTRVLRLLHHCRTNALTLKEQLLAA